jgi:hypothetical protein
MVKLVSILASAPEPSLRKNNLPTMRCLLSLPEEKMVFQDCG